MDPRNPCDSTQGFSPSRTRGTWLHEHHKTKLSILEHQTWWERSSKERNARNKMTRQDEAQYTRTSSMVGEELKRKKRLKQKHMTRRSSAYSNIKRGGRGGQNEKKEMSKGKKHQTFEPSWPNGKYLWISSETRKELISRPKDDDDTLLIRITRCRSTIRHARRPHDYDAIPLTRIIRCRSIIRHARRPYDYDAILLIRIIRCRSIIRHARRPYDHDAILLIRIIRCKSIILHGRWPYDYDAILLIRIIRCKNIIRHAKIAKKTHTHRGRTKRLRNEERVQAKIKGDLANTKKSRTASSD